MAENLIKTKCITELLGLNFYIPDYQRGYRWTEKNVLQLLDDIWEYRQEKSNKDNFYCLQPIVVREYSWKNEKGQFISGYELIDGQQRLTTIHRILTAILLERYGKLDLISRGYPANLFSIYYETRLSSKTFLESTYIDESKPDLYYMSQAMTTIKEWLSDTKRGIPEDTMDEIRKIILPGLKRDDKNEIILPEWSAQVIWYEINDTNQKSKDLFTRLNRGKIPLTSAELIKAKFVNENSFKGLEEDVKIKRRTQLIQIWDEIENQLNNPKFWSFVSNDAFTKYSSKIEYLFDIQTKKTSNQKDPLYSFLKFFEEKETAESLWQKWIVVEEIFRSLVYWYADRKWYHKIGYLIATGLSIRALMDLKKSNSKSTFEKEIDLLISNTIADDIHSLSFENHSDHEKIRNILLLVNIEMIRENQKSNDFFPFEIYKSITKSLEHIHAQNIADINQNKREEWNNWLNAHLAILLNVTEDRPNAQKLIDDIAKIDRNANTYKFDDFRAHSEAVLKLIPKEDVPESDYLHKIQNLALLGLIENIQLKNSVFEVKRNVIIDLDRNGTFIPLATKRVFLKYYADSNTNLQYSIWSQAEREVYLTEIEKYIGNYKQTKKQIKDEE